MKTITMKFGGTSVGSPEALTNLAGIVKAAREAGDRVIVVVSAFSGVTDQRIFQMLGSRLAALMGKTRQILPTTLKSVHIRC